MGFFRSLIRELIDGGNTVDIATNETEAPVSECYREWGCNVHAISCTRSPFSVGTVKAIREIRKIVKEGQYDIVHCHTPIAAMCTRIACQSFREKGLKVIYTAHGFHFYKGAPLKNWLVYYPVEKLCSYFTDVLITINQEDYALAQKKMRARRIEYVPGVGIDVAKFRDAEVDRDEKRRELGIPEDALLLVSVGELNENKNHQIVIRAMAELKDPKIHYAIAGRGDSKDMLLKLAEELGVGAQFHLLGYRRDIAQLYKSADICVFPSIREGLPVALMEAMACGLPLVSSDNRGSKDCASHRDNGLLCRADSVEEFAAAIRMLKYDTSQRNRMGSKNRERAEVYDVKHINKRMKSIYAALDLKK